MTGRELHQLINSLDRREKSNFAKFTDSNAECNQAVKRPKFLQLFDRMAKQKEYDEDGVRGTLFKSSVKFYQTREKLLDKIIQSLVFYGDEKLSARSYIQQALKFDAIELAQKKLASELKLAHQSQDQDYLHYLLTLKEKIEFSYRMVLEVPEEIVEIDEAQFDYQHLLTLRGVLRRLQRVIRSGKNVNPTLGANQFLNEIKDVPTPSPESRYLYFKIRCYLEVMQVEMELAYRFQQQATRELEQMGPIFRNALLAKEYFFLVQLSLKNNDLEMVQRTVFKFSQIDPENKKEQEIKNDYWIQAAISAGNTHGNLQMIEGVMPLLKQNTLLFSPELYVLNLFLAAKVYFVHQEYTKALEAIELIRSVKKCKWPELYWAVETLRYVTHAGLDNEDVLDSIARSAIRFAEAVDANLPKLSSRYAQRMIRSRNEEDKTRILNDFLLARKIGSSDPKEKIAIDLLDLTFWFQHQAQGISLLDAYLTSNDQGFPKEEKMAN